jgi:hypothetical protein
MMYFRLAVEIEKVQDCLMQDGLKDKQLRRDFMKLLGAGTLSLALGAYGISNPKKR